MNLSRFNYLGHVGLLQVKSFQIQLAKLVICTQNCQKVLSSEIEQFVAVFHFYYY